MLQAEIDSIKLNDIKNNNDHRVIKYQFKTISQNIEAIRKGKKPYGLDYLDDIKQAFKNQY